MCKIVKIVGPGTFHFSCLLDYGVPVFTDDVASLNYPVFKGPATL
jgi:hypothetical protein